MKREREREKAGGIEAERQGNGRARCDIIM